MKAAGASLRTDLGEKSLSTPALDSALGISMEKASLA